MCADASAVHIGNVYGRGLGKEHHCDKSTTSERAFRKAAGPHLIGRGKMGKIRRDTDLRQSGYADCLGRPSYRRLEGIAIGGSAFVFWNRRVWVIRWCEHSLRS